MKEDRKSEKPIKEVRVAETVGEAFTVADDVRLGAAMNDPDQRFKGVFQPFDNPERARRLNKLSRKIENQARRTLGWPEV